MSMQFNPGDGTGLVDEINDIAQSDNNSFPLPSKARRLNHAKDRFIYLAMKVRNWRYDDGGANNDLPFAYTDVDDGVDDYGFASEMLVLVKLYFKDPSTGKYYELIAEDENDDSPDTITQNAGSGLPTKFRLVGNSVILNRQPEEDITNGLLAYFQRPLQRFTAASTTETAGIPSIFDMWLCQYAAMLHLVDLQKSAKNDVSLLEQEGERSIKDFLSNRNQTRRKRQMRFNTEDNR